MSSLIVLCPHCLTWIEIHAHACTECGGGVDIDDRDLDPEIVEQRLGEWLVDLGCVRLLRRGWPNVGGLLASTEGLLFVPQFIVRPSGALVAISEGATDGPDRLRNLIPWWSLPVWRRTTTEIEPTEAVAIPRQPLRDLLYDSPGAFFIRRDSIRRVLARWGRVQIERSPARMVSLTSASAGSNLRESLRRLMDHAPWRSLVAEL